ncbi:hypothetical protein [Neptunomonas antarctica]|uniref:Uncharacterized protein n=1 Tax=Neptunomonas antarctica TaxID=619304 RepID=A0A1N7J5Q6_9GAMM|nr:hypothetical protein [Neptunomonas antarctica]SIS44571.1 hypothetical protein SAMN05421760_101642 [Neptunomonas antarctica]
MKSSTLNTLLVAKSILGETKYLVNSGDKYSCTAGIILLQDFVELVVLAALDELDVEEQRSLASMPFDGLLGELKKLKVPIIKSGTIKALNKQRVISKHYGQLAEPTSVINYFDVALKFVDALLEHVVGSKLQDIFLTDILNDGVVKTLVKQSIEFSEQDKFLDSLICLRKAFFVAYEYDYSVYYFRNGLEKKSGLLGLSLRGGIKANYWAKDKEWIRTHVKKPMDYMQVNHAQLKTDCMELGVSTVDIENFRRLTPEVIRTEDQSWHFEYTTSFVANEINKDNFNFCLDILLNFLLKKQEFDSSRKYPKYDKSIMAPPIYIGKPVFEKPSQRSSVLTEVRTEYYYTVERVVTGFDSSERYFYVYLYPQKEQYQNEEAFQGFLLIEDSSEGC